MADTNPTSTMEVTQGELATTDSIGIRALKDITFGSVAGITSKFFEHPFDLTKVRLQSQVLDAQARFSGPLDCLLQTWRKEGVAGLYRVRLLSVLPAPPLLPQCTCYSRRVSLIVSIVDGIGSTCADRRRDGRERVALLVIHRDPERSQVGERDVPHHPALPRPARACRRGCRSRH